MGHMKFKGHYSSICGKWRYPDEVEAKIALANIHHTDSSRRGKAERRAYQCGRCKGGWHLTSKVTWTNHKSRKKEA